MTDKKPQGRIQDMFARSFHHRDFRDAPKVLTIRAVDIIEFEDDDGPREKARIRFEGTRQVWYAGPGEAVPSIVEALDTDEVDEWIGSRIELYEGETDFGGKIVDCIRGREVGSGEDSDRAVVVSADTPSTGSRRQEPEKTERRRPRAKPRLALDNEFPKLLGENDDGTSRMQIEEGGPVWDVHADDIQAVMSGEMKLTIEE